MKLTFRVFAISFFFLIYSDCIFAQGAAFELSSYPRFARAMRLANAYTGVAEGPEATFYNSAGLADINYYGALFSTGMGAAIFLENTSSNDYVIYGPLPNNIGTVALSLNYLSLNLSSFMPGAGKDVEAVYNIHYARNFSKWFSAGIRMSSYVSRFENVQTVGSQGAREITGQAFDFSLSALLKFPGFNPEGDLFRAGLQLSNLTNTKIKFENLPQDDFKYQQARLGMSYLFVPALKHISGFRPLSVLLTGDLVFKGYDYKFYNYNPDFGVELSIFELLQLSFGRENEKIIEETYTNSPQHPVNRYGFGLDIPFGRLLNTRFPLEMKLDYCVSDWDHINERDASAFSSFYPKFKFSNKAFSAQVRLFL